MKRKISSILKRLIKLKISLSVFAYSYLLVAMKRLLGRRVPASCVVLYYHAIPAEHRMRFARQMDVLVRRVKPIPAATTAPLVEGERYAAVTFDDAFESVLRNAVPELEKRQIPATIFVITGLIGQAPGWEGYPERTMTLDELKELPADLVTIGSHTMTHPALPALSEQEVKDELCESRARLEEMLQRKISLFSFPYGAFEEKMTDWCREAGYERIFTTLPHFAFSTPREFVTGRVPVEPDDWPLEFSLKLAGAYCWLPWAISVKRKFLGNRQNIEKLTESRVPHQGSTPEAAQTGGSGRRN